MRGIKYQAVLWLLLLAQGVAAQTPVVHKHTVASKALGEERPIWVGLPYNYDSTRTYPTIYLLDAEWHFEITHAITKEMAVQDQIPAHILIGIPHITPPKRFKELTFSTSKVDDLGRPDSVGIWTDTANTGRGIAFLRFLEQEVVPTVNQLYPTNGFDVLVGHSLGGYFAAHALSRPTTFNAFQAYDASVWYNDGDAMALLQAQLPKAHATNVYLTTATDSGRQDQNFIDKIAALGTALQAYPNINVAAKVYENENHGTMLLLSVLDGFKQLYHGYSFGYIKPDAHITADEYAQHFNNFSKKVHFTFAPPVDGFRWVGYANFKQEKWHQALEAYQRCMPAFAHNFAVHYEMGHCYEQLGQLKLALQHYQQAQALNPDNDLVNARVKELVPQVK